MTPKTNTFMPNFRTAINTDDCFSDNPLTLIPQNRVCNFCIATVHSTLVNEGIPQCLRITKKVSLNIESEDSYVYILSGQKLIKNAKNGPIWQVFENL